MPEKLLVVGARQGGLGAYVADAARRAGYVTMTAGPEGCDVKFDITNEIDIWNAVKMVFDHVVCTAGINLPGTTKYLWNLETQVEVNFISVAKLLDEWIHFKPLHKLGHFVAISSNSARIPRSQSGGYCASKAALEMYLRCAARERAKENVAIYAYSPGWIIGTPMSKAVLQRLLEEPPHRIPSGKGIEPTDLAQMIVNNLKTGRMLNGCIVPADGGEI